LHLIFRFYRAGRRNISRSFSAVNAAQEAHMPKKRSGSNNDSVVSARFDGPEADPVGDIIQMARDRVWLLEHAAQWYLEQSHGQQREELAAWLRVLQDIPGILNSLEREIRRQRQNAAAVKTTTDRLH
jgi:hypothetical protein